jgi:uncharacterized protein
MPEQLRIDINEYQSVTSNVYAAKPKGRLGVTLILGHGAGAGQSSDFMVSFATELALRGIDTATFNFFYSEHGRSAPDPNDKLEACYRAVIDGVREHKKLARNKLAIGGKSMGGRIASQVAAADTKDIAALVFLGYPLHPPGRPENARSKHLPSIKSPMLFVQGSRDAFGTAEELGPVVKKLGSSTLYVVEGGDHSLKVPKSSGKTQDQVYREVQDEIARWMAEVIR